MRDITSILLTGLLVMQVVCPAYSADSVASQVTAMPNGAHLEVRLKNRQKMRGTRGPVSNSGFTLLETGAGQDQIAFDDVASVKQLKSHLTRNILILAAIGVAAIGITAAILLRCGPLGCNSHL